MMPDSHMNDQASASKWKSKTGAQLVPAAQAVPAIPDSYGTVGAIPRSWLFRRMIA